MNLYNADWNEELPDCCPEKEGHRPSNEKINYKLYSHEEIE